jgi:bacterioferritin
VKLPKGQDKVIEILNQVLTNELTGINQYFVHAKICENWGYKRLAKRIRDESIDEMKHADEIIDRVLFLEGVPNLQRLGKVNVGETIPEALTLDLDLERGAIVYLNESLETVRALGDHGTFHLLTEILTSEEHHADWLEAQLEQIKQVGVENYLATQIAD